MIQLAIAFLLFQIPLIAGVDRRQEDNAEQLKDLVDKDPRALIPTSIDRIGRVWVPVFINKKGPFRMALDTGADSTAILQKVVEEAGLANQPKETILVHGVTGSRYTQSVKVDSVMVADLELGSMTLPILSDAFEGADGILGTRGLQNMRIHLDFEKDFFQMRLSENQRAPAGFYSVPISLRDNLLLEIKARLGKVDTRVIFDTGSQKTIGNYKLREKLFGTTPNGIEQEIVGVTLDSTKGRNEVAPSILLGNVQVDNLTIAFSDAYIFKKWNLEEEPALLLGMDAIATMKAVIIDYKKGKLYVKVQKR